MTNQQSARPAFAAAREGKREPQSEIAIVTLFRSRMRILAPAVSIVSVPNAAKRTQWAAQRAKREGMATGFPDLMAIGPGRIAFLEFKAEKGGRVSDNQAEWIERLRAYGFPAGVFSDADAAVEFLRINGFPFIGRIAA